MAEGIRKAGKIEEEFYPLSYGQKALWFLHLWAPESVAYNVSWAAHIHSMVDTLVLQKTLEISLDRHPCLRTTFLSDSIGLRQIVHKDSVGCFEHLDISNYSQEEIEQLIIKTHRRPFNLVDGPVIRLSLFTHTPTDHILLISIHHIVFDFSSLKIFLEELFALYSLAQKGKEDSLPPVTSTYADFVRWQNDFLTSAEGKTQEAYWRQQLSGNLPVFNLPTDYPRPLRQSFQGRSIYFTIDTTETERLINFARTERAPLEMVLLAAYLILLFRYCDQDEILVGSSTSGRFLKGKFARVIGYFVNTIVLRNFLKGDFTFRESLRQVGHTVKAALVHQDYPFPLLVEKMHPSRDSSRSPFYQADFSFLKTKGEAFINMMAGSHVVTEDLTFERYPVAMQEGQVDLALEIYETKNTLTCYLKGDADLFEASTLERMGGNFRVLLEGIITNPSQCIASLPLLTEAEEHRLQVELNDNRVAYPDHRCLHHLFEESVVRHPGAIAVEYAGLRLSYGGLNQKANQLARHLQALGVKPETTVGIFVDRSFEMIIGLLGVLKAGGAYVPMDPVYPPKRLKFIMAEAGISLMLTSAKYRADISFLDIPIICLDTDSPRWQGESDDNPLSEVRPENLAYLTYTSGSTGRPKGVMVEHRSIVNHNYAVIDQFELTEKDRVLQFSKINFDVAAEEIYPTLMAGGMLVLPQPEDCASIAEFQRFIQTQRLTVLNLPSSYWHAWVSDPSQHGIAVSENLRLVIIGSEKVNLTSFEKWRQTVPDSVQLINAYGLTETTITATIWKFASFPKAKTLHSVPIGRPLANIQVYILDAFQQICPIGVPGELYLGGACLARGYKARPELNDRIFIKNPWSKDSKAKLCKTGDLARYLPDGTIEYIGRSDNQVKIRGYRIELDEIEAVLNAHPLVAKNAVIVNTSNGGEACLIAYLILHQDKVIDKEDLQTFLSERLPEYMIPAAFIALPSLPLDPKGRIDHQALAKSVISRDLLSDEAFVAPRNDDESKLVEIWKGLLGLERISVFDNFFNLGGHSLLAVQLTSKIGQAFKVDLPLPYLFQSPTIAGITEAIRRANHTGFQDLTSKIEVEENDQQLLEEILRDLPPYSLKAEDRLKGVQAVLLTGVTGFLGSFLLAELLQQSTAQMYCLVRPSTNGHPFLKIKNVLESYALWEEEYRPRIIPVRGDLAMPFLGLERSLFNELSSKIEAIYHSGAWVNHLYPYSVLRATNVSGTLEVIRLAAAIRTKPVHYISTMHGLSDLDYHQETEKNQFFNGYVRSKWMAEKLVRRAGEQGLPVCIYRPSRITGHQQTGISNSKDFLSLLIKGCIQLGKAPQWGPIREYLTPVDYVSGAVVYLSRQGDNYNKIFDILHNHRPVSWDELLSDQLPSLGYDLEQVSYSDWRKALSEQTQNALYPLLSLFPARENFLDEGETGGTSLEVSPGKDFQNTLTGLAGSNLGCPPLNKELLRTYMTYFKTIGFFD